MLNALGSRRLWAAVLTVALVWSFCAPWCAELGGGAEGCATAAAEAPGPCAADGDHHAHGDCPCACPHAPILTSTASARSALPVAAFALPEAPRPPSLAREPLLHVPIA